MTGVRFDPRRNSLNFLRLGFASAVIVSHAGPLLGRSEWTIGRDTIGRWAVVSFFILSGFLITRSRLRLPAARYYWDRFLRIMPAFVLALVVTAFVFAPVSTLFTHRVFNPHSALSYVIHDLPLFQRDIAQLGIAHTDPHLTRFSGTWNGPLYTLFYEGLCYVAIGVAATVLRERILKWLMPLVAVGFGVWASSVSMAHATEFIGHVVPFSAAFAAGATCWLWKDRIPCGRVAVAVYVCATVGMTWADLAAGTVAVPYALILLWLGDVMPFSKVGSVHDVSYGMYLYAWPVQTVLVLAFPGIVLHWNRWLDIAVVSALTLGPAYLSRVWVEEPALRLRRLVPG